MDWFIANWTFVAGLAAMHLSVSVVPIAVGAFLAIVFTRITPPRWSNTARGALGAIYAIPSLALFVTLPALIGTDFTGPTNVVIALTIYAIASMYFSAHDAFNQVPRPTVSNAESMGMNPRQIFVHVELPMAVPGLIAGLRVTAASIISIASIGAVVGVRNLGNLFIDGFQRKIPEEIITGVLAIFVIALTLDAGLWLVGRMLTRWRFIKVEHA
ncbi:MAG: ABC transporter permease subunit [Actinobacteria bacterium]|nr:ABC transporter permease subunit [Actinomycetota bacterium]